MLNNRQRTAWRKRPTGFTLLELLVTISIIIVLAALLLPSVARSFNKARQIECLSRLRQIGLGMASFAHDHNGRYPMQIPNLQGGSMWDNRNRLPVSPLLSFSARHFQVLSNELSSTKLVLCPADKKKEGLSFGRLTAAQISFWVFYPAAPGNSTHPLAGDWNVQSVDTNRSIISGRTNLLTVRFNEQLHELKGNILFADGHVELVRNVDLPAGFAPDNSLTRITTPTDQTKSPAASPGKPTDPVLTARDQAEDKTAATTQTEPDVKTTSAADGANSPADGPANEVALAATNALASTNFASSSAPPSKQPLVPVQSALPQGVGGKSLVSEPGGPSAAASMQEVTAPNDDRAKRLRQAQMAIKFAFLLGIILIILGLVWYYLHRRRRESERGTREEPEFARMED